MRKTEKQIIDLVKDDPNYQLYICPIHGVQASRNLEKVNCHRCDSPLETINLEQATATNKHK